MKKILFLLLTGLFLAACGSTPEKTETASGNLAELKDQLKAKEVELSAIRTEIDSLKARITVLDPSFNQKEVSVVELIPVQKGDFKHFVEVQGTILADEEVMVSSELPGKIKSLLVEQGDVVRQGQLIATIDAESAEKGIEELKTSLELATDLYERQQRLWEQNIGSEIQFLQAKNNKERLEKSLVTAELNLKKAKIYSPMSGTITMVLGKQGEVTSPGLPIVKLINTSKVKLKADVPEVYVKDVRRNDLVEVRVPVLDLEQQARVSRVGTVINSNNRTFEVEVSLSNPKAQLKPNLLALLMINDYASEDAISIPLELVQQDVSGHHFVYVADKRDTLYTVRKIEVKPGQVFDGTIEILSGLNGDEMLIGTGSQYLADGEQVKVKS